MLFENFFSRPITLISVSQLNARVVHDPAVWSETVNKGDLQYFSEVKCKFTLRDF